MEESGRKRPANDSDMFQESKGVDTSNRSPREHTIFRDSFNDLALMCDVIYSRSSSKAVSHTRSSEDQQYQCSDDFRVMETLYSLLQWAYYLRIDWELYFHQKDEIKDNLLLPKNIVRDEKELTPKHNPVYVQRFEAWERPRKILLIRDFITDTLFQILNFKSMTICMRVSSVQIHLICR